MKISKAIVVSIGFLAAAAALLPAQNYELRSATIANGGGTSSGGRYVLSDTIGQPVTAPMSGGAYTFQGGFWNLVTLVPTLGAPTLDIRPVANNRIVVSWPSSATGFVLQRAASLGSPEAWIDVTTPVVVLAGNNTVTQLVAADQRYYRLCRAGP